ncbi:hypothetical protein ACEPAF_3613 [Sanghuangporus sanghuang]
MENVVSVGIRRAGLWALILGLFRPVLPLPVPPDMRRPGVLRIGRWAMDAGGPHHARQTSHQILPLRNHASSTDTGNGLRFQQAPHDH